MLVPKENDEEAARVYVHTNFFFYSVSLSLSLSYSFIIHTLTIVLRFKSMFFWYRYVPKLNITFRQKSIKIQIKLQRKKINSLSHGWPIYFVQKYCLSFSMYCLLIQIIIYVSLFSKHMIFSFVWEVDRCRKLKIYIL
jgi:hypothetical protein